MRKQSGRVVAHPQNKAPIDIHQSKCSLAAGQIGAGVSFEFIKTGYWERAMQNSEPVGVPSAGLARWKVAALMTIVIVAAYALREHWGHLLGWSPYLLLACPLMHLFMHHGGHSHHGNQDDKQAHLHEKPSSNL